MKLVKCYVSSFGKLKDFTYDFTDGLNTFKQDNGWGKSTLATFIKAMFYGLNSSKRSVSENERIKYKPWNSTEIFGGYVCFSWGGNEYKLERYFGNKESEDTVKLSDVKTGKSFSNTENLGKRIFEIDEEGFLSTTYFSQKDFQAKSNTSLTAKFNSVCEIEDSESFDKALLKIEEKAKLYKYRGDKGLISEKKAEQFLVNEEIERAHRANETASLIKEETKILEEQTEKLKKDASVLAERVAKAGKVEAVLLKRTHLKDLTKEKNQLEQAFIEADTVLGGKTFDEQSLSGYEECAERLSDTLKAKEMLSAEIDALREKSEQIKKPKNNTKLTATFFALCSAFLILSIVLFFIKPLFGVVSAVFCAVTGVFAILNIFRNKTPDSLFVYQSMIEEKIKAYEEYSVIARVYEERLNSFMNLLGVGGADDYRAVISAVRNALSQRESARKKLNEIQQLTGRLSEELKDYKDIEETENVSLLKSKLFEVQTEYTKKANLLASKRASIKSYTESVERIPDLEDKKAELSELIEEYKVDYEILNLTAEYLKKANDNLKAKYRAPLEDSLNRYFSLISGKDNQVRIDIDLSVTVQEPIGEKVVEYYSKGYQNLFEICKRFALTDVLFTGEKPFIILDDPFYNLDDEKLSSALELIKKLSNQYQIIYLVCHESRRA